MFVGADRDVERLHAAKGLAHQDDVAPLALARDVRANFGDEARVVAAGVCVRAVRLPLQHVVVAAQRRKLHERGERVAVEARQRKEERAVCRVHTAYSGDLFSFFAFDAALASERSRLAALIGEEAEPLVHLFGTVARHEFVGLGRMMENRTHDADMLEGPVRARSRLGPDVTLDAATVAELVVVTIADYLDQTLEVNGWRDHHMVDPLDTPLFPGDMRPEVCLFWMAAACRAVKDSLEVVPPIFDSCTATLTSQDEERARDLYWGVVQNRSHVTDADALRNLNEAALRNPYVGEVDALAAQLHFRNHRFRKAKRLAASALRKLYAMGATWDKRLSYEAWVGFCRLLVVRAEAEGGLPRAPGAHNVNDLGVRLVPIDRAVELMP